MAGTMIGRPGGFVTVAVAASLFVPGVALAARSSAEVSISSKVPAFHGRISSDDKSCRDDRKVELYRKGARSGGGKKLGKDKTSSDGRWAIEVSDIGTGVYFAKVKGTKSCGGAKSETVVAD